MTYQTLRLTPYSLTVTELADLGSSPETYNRAL